MRKLSLAAALLCAQPIFATSANTIITGTYTSPSGPNPSGTLTISWNRFQNDAVPKQTVYPGRIVVTVTNGVIPNVSLFPNAAALPTGTCFNVSAALAGVTSQRYWYVPISATPVDVGVVESSIPCSPGTSATISPSQIANAGATLGQVLAWNGNYYAPANGGGSGGSPLFSAILSGVNNSNQTFTMANGIINTSGGGIIAANQILTTPITGLSGTGGRLVQGLGSYTLGDLGSFDASGNLIDSGIVGANVILSTGSYANPSWITSLDGSKLSGTVPCARLPGTTGDVTQSAGSCATLVLSTNGTPFALSATINALNASNINTGTLPSAQLPLINLASSAAGGVTGNLQAVNVNGGLNADTSHYLRGDMTWQLISAGGTVTHTFGPLNAGAVAVGNSGADITVLPTLGLTGQTLHANPIGSPNWALLNLTTDVTGVNPGANGGTGTAFLQFAGPTTLRTYTGPDANTTLLTTNAAVTPAQGGFGADFSSVAKGGMVSGTGAGTFGITAVGTNGKVWTANSGATGGADWETAAAGGTVTSIVFTAPLSAITITTSGTVGCATCVTSAGALALNQLVIGGALQATSTLGSLGTTTTLLHGNAGGPPSFGQVVNSDIANGTIDLAAKVTGVLPFANVFPSGTQGQFLNIKPNAGNNTTIQWESALTANMGDYSFPAITPTGSPSITIGSNTVTIPLAPLGLNGTDTNHFIRISGGTGTAEQVAITGGSCTELATACTLIFTAANTHSGAYTFTSATAGLQEAINHVGSSAVILVPTGTNLIYSPSYTAAGFITIKGNGPFNSLLQAQSATTGILDLVGPKNVIEDIGFTATVQQTSGGYAIRLGNGGGNENSFTRINHIYCEPMYDCVLGVNASLSQVTNSTFYNFSHVAITAQDTTNPDFEGAYIRGNTFYNYNLSSAATAAVVVNSTSSLEISDNVIIGGGANQLNDCIEWNSSTSGGWLNITGNKCEKALVEGVLVTGTLVHMNISGNTFGNTQSVSGWSGIHINSTSLKWSAITGNTIQCGSTTNNGIFLQGSYQTLAITGNTIDSCNFGVNANTTAAGSVQIGSNLISNAGTFPVFASASNIVVVDSGALTFSGLTSTSLGLGSAGNGSRAYCSDCNSACTAGSSTGRSCVRENGAWTH